MLAARMPPSMSPRCPIAVRERRDSTDAFRYVVSLVFVDIQHHREMDDMACIEYVAGITPTNRGYLHLSLGFIEWLPEPISYGYARLASLISRWRRPC
jgi:hypothetical protein